MRVVAVVTVLALLVLGVALAFELETPKSTPGFHIEFSKTGGIAGVNDVLTIDRDGTASVGSKYGASFNTTVGPVVLAELRNSIASGLAAIQQDRFQATGGAADYFAYSLTVKMDGTVREIAWVDGWAAVGGLPQELQHLQGALDETMQILTAQATFANTNSAQTTSCQSGGRPTGCGLGLTVYTDRTTYKTGDQVRIFALVTNASPTKINYTSPTPCDPDIRLVVSGAQGTRDVSYSNLPPVPCAQVLQQRTLGPDQTLTLSGTWDQSFTKTDTTISADPGSYTVSARMPYAQFENQLLAVSVTITIER